jgi:long-chain acyl-CoA synthetase
VELSRLVHDAAAGHGTRPALIDRAGTLTWAEAEARVAATAGALQAAGVAAGDRVAVLAPNGQTFAVAAWAVFRAGASLVPVNPMYTPPEVRHLLGDAGVGVLLCTAELEGAASSAAAPLDPAPDVVVIGAGGLSGAPVETSPARTEDCAVICYTSGTSGRPKGARLSHGNILATLGAIDGMRHLQITEEDVLLGVLPFNHVFGLNVILNAAARHGAAVLALDRFSPHGSLAAMAEHGVTVAYGAPPMFAAWCAMGDDDSSRVALRAAVSGADTLPEATWSRFKDRFGIEILEGYGLTETAPVLTSTAMSPQVRPDTVGHPVDGVELRLVDETGRDVKPGGTGEILARGPNVFSGYHNLPEASAEALRDGWFHTGDLGTRDDAGYLKIAGRLKDMIIVSGFNVYPREVEDALLSHPGVAEAAVVGIPDERTGERVHATVVPRGDAELGTDELIDHCRSCLARYKLPRDVDIVAALPRTAMGKVRRSALRPS